MLDEKNSNRSIFKTYEKAKDELISEVVNKSDLFSSNGELKDKETAEKQVINP